MNNRASIDKLLDFIQDTTFDSLSEEVKSQAIKCFLDLASVACAGAKNNTSKKAALYVSKCFPQGGVTLLHDGSKTNLIGGALANGMASNALDMDDGYSLLRGHPGAGFFGALISAAEIADCTYGEFLSALVVAYEVSIREGYAIRDFYKWDHSSGSYSAFGTAASVGKLLSLSRRELEMALGIADFCLPVVPAKRSCYVPSMNKDGIYFGQHVGTQAVMMAKQGMTGKNPIIADEEYSNYIETLGSKYYLFDLYIKFYSCCRWAHSPICAVADLMNKNKINISEISKVDIYSFGNAGTLYKHAPTCEDEAQYNIIYPIVAQVIFGNCGPLESSTTKMLDPRVEPMIKKVEFHHEPEYDKVFPAKRLSRVHITMNNGTVFISEATEPKGDRNAEVTIEDLKIKAHDINGIYAPKDLVEQFVNTILYTDSKEPFSKMLKIMQELARTNVNKDIMFI